MACFGEKSKRKRDLLGSALFVNVKLSYFGVLYPEPCHKFLPSQASCFPLHSSPLRRLTVEVLSKAVGSPQTSLLLQEPVAKCKGTWLNIKLYLPFDSKGENLGLFHGFLTGF